MLCDNAIRIFNSYKTRLIFSKTTIAFIIDVYLINGLNKYKKECTHIYLVCCNTYSPTYHIGQYNTPAVKQANKPGNVTPVQLKTSNPNF